MRCPARTGVSTIMEPAIDGIGAGAGAGADSIAGCGRDADEAVSISCSAGAWRGAGIESRLSPCARMSASYTGAALRTAIGFNRYERNSATIAAQSIGLF